MSHLSDAFAAFLETAPSFFTTNACHKALGLKTPISNTSRRMVRNLLEQSCTRARKFEPYVERRWVSPRWQGPLEVYDHEHIDYRWSGKQPRYEHTPKEMLKLYDRAEAGRHWDPSDVPCARDLSYAHLYGDCAACQVWKVGTERSGNGRRSSGVHQTMTQSDDVGAMYKAVRELFERLQKCKTDQQRYVAALAAWCAELDAKYEGADEQRWSSRVRLAAALPWRDQLLEVCNYAMLAWSEISREQHNLLPEEKLPGQQGAYVEHVARWVDRAHRSLVDKLSFLPPPTDS